MSLAVLAAILSTVSIGTGEFLAADVTKRARSHEVTCMMLVSGVLLTGVVAVVWPGDPSSRDLVFGAIAGATNGIGILVLYMAYSRGSLRSAAPTAAVIMTAVPVLWELFAIGRDLSTPTMAGIVLGLIAIALSSYQPDETGGAINGDRQGLPIAIAAGVIFGLLLILLGEIGEDAGGTPLVIQRGVGFVVAVIITRATGPRVFPEHRADQVRSLIVGIFATAAIVLFVLSLQLGGGLSMASVLSSQYAGVAVVLGVIFRGERLLRTQTAGLIAAGVAVALITLG